MYSRRRRHVHFLYSNGLRCARYLFLAQGKDVIEVTLEVFGEHMQNNGVNAFYQFVFTYLCRH